MDGAGKRPPYRNSLARARYSRTISIALHPSDGSQATLIHHRRQSGIGQHLSQREPATLPFWIPIPKILRFMKGQLFRINPMGRLYLVAPSSNGLVPRKPLSPPICEDTQIMIEKLELTLLAAGAITVLRPVVLLALIGILPLLGAKLSERTITYFTQTCVSIGLERIHLILCIMWSLTSFVSQSKWRTGSVFHKSIFNWSSNSFLTGCQSPS